MSQSILNTDLSTNKENANLGTLYIISSPSGGGKTTLVKALTSSMMDIQVSVSHTTRPARPGEQEGIHYHFVDKDMFQKLQMQRIFLECAEVFEHYYGTSKHWVLETLARGIDVILEIDWQGAQLIRQQIPQAVSIFILPPSSKILRERLSVRAQDAHGVIEFRLNAASEEISHYNEYDYLIVNDNFEAALDDLRAVVRARRLICPRQALKYQALLASFLH